MHLVLLAPCDSLPGLSHVYVSACKYDSFFLYMRDSSDGLLFLTIVIVIVISITCIMDIRRPCVRRIFITLTSGSFTWTQTGPVHEISGPIGGFRKNIAQEICTFGKSHNTDFNLKITKNFSVNLKTLHNISQH